MRRRLVATLAIVLVTALALVGCNAGGGAASDPTLGRYEGYAISIFDNNEPIGDTYDEGENYVELQAEGKAVVCLDGNPLKSTYKLDGEKITLVIDEGDGQYNSEGTLKDGVLTFDFLSLGLDLTFVKEGVDKPFEVVSSKPTDVSSDAGAQEGDAATTGSADGAAATPEGEAPAADGAAESTANADNAGNAAASGQ